MDEHVHIILAVDIADLAVRMSRFFDLVPDHCLLSLEVLKAIFISALDLHLELPNGRGAAEIARAAKHSKARSSSEWGIK